MAVKGFIQVNQSSPLGNNVVSVGDILSQLIYASEVIADKAAQSMGDDPSGTSLASLLGVADAATAIQVNNLLGSLKTDLNNPSNSFLQFRARINRI